MKAAFYSLLGLAVAIDALYHALMKTKGAG